MEGFAREIPLPKYLLATIAMVGRTRRMVGRLARISCRSGRPGAARLGRNLWRRQLCLGEKRGDAVGKTKRGKGTKWMVVASGQSVPLGVQLASASPHESTLIESTLAQIKVPRRGRGRPRSKPKRLIYDKAGDSDPLRKRLQKRGDWANKVIP